jgi:hypothetical protein
VVPLSKGVQSIRVRLHNISHPPLELSSGLFPSGYPVRTLCEFLFGMLQYFKTLCSG